MNNVWKKCSSCKKEILLKEKYFVCNVSTCNSKRRGFTFCSVKCWDAHLPLMNHREAWAEERFAPASIETIEEKPRRRIVTSPSSSTASQSSADLPEDILVVVSKLKAYVKAKGDMNTSGDVADRLSDFLRSQCDDAIIRARQEGRKTVMAKDFS